MCLFFSLFLSSHLHDRRKLNLLRTSKICNPKGIKQVYLKIDKYNLVGKYFERESCNANLCQGRVQYPSIPTHFVSFGLQWPALHSLHLHTQIHSPGLLVQSRQEKLLYSRSIWSFGIMEF